MPRHWKGRITTNATVRLDKQTIYFTAAKNEGEARHIFVIFDLMNSLNSCQHMVNSLILL